MVALAKSRSWLDDCGITIRETNNVSGAYHLYSVAALTDNNGAVVERYRYDAYGQRTVLEADGTTVRAASLYGNQIGFTGRYLDAETGLYYFRARYYSGTLGRFVSRDRRNAWLKKVSIPLSLDGYKDGMNLYMAFFIPATMDPLGTSPLPPVGDICQLQLKCVTIKCEYAHRAVKDEDGQLMEDLYWITKSNCKQGRGYEGCSCQFYEEDEAPPTPVCMRSGEGKKVFRVTNPFYVPKPKSPEQPPLGPDGKPLKPLGEP